MERSHISGLIAAGCGVEYGCDAGSINEAGYGGGGCYNKSPGGGICIIQYWMK